MNLSDYWYNKLDIDYNRVKKFWKSKHKKRLVRELKKRPLESLKKIGNLFSVKFEQDETVESISNKISESKNAIEVLCCVDYYEKHIKTIEDCLQDENIHKILIKSDLEDKLLALIKIYKTKPDLIVQINIIHKWKRLGTNEEFICYRPLTKGIIDKIQSKRRSISLYLKKKDKNNFSYRILGPYSYDEDYYFLLQRQTNYRSERNYDRSKIRKPVAELLYQFDLKEKKIECRYSRIDRENSNVTKRIISKIKKHADRWFEKQKGDPQEGDILEEIPNKMLLSKEQLEEKPPEAFQVVGISLSNVNLPGKVGLDIPKNNSDVRPALYQLREDGIVNNELLKNSIKELWVKWKNRKPRKVVFNKKDHPFLILQPDFRHLSPKERTDFDRDFSDSFIPLNQLIDLSKNPKEELYLIRSLIQYQNIGSPLSIKQEKINELKEINLISVKEREVKLCTNCGHKKLVSEKKVYELCEECKSTRLVTPRWSKEFEIKPNREGIVDFLVNLTSKEGLEINNPNSQRTFLKKYSFIEFSLGEDNVYVFLEEEKINPKQLSYFSKSCMPIMIVSTGELVSEDLVKEHSFLSYENLASIYFSSKENNLEGDFFKKRFKDVLKNSEDKIVDRAEKSARNLRKWLIDKTGQTNRDEFETDCYNIFAYLLVNSERWGQKLTDDKELPDGIGGIVHNGEKYEYKNCLIWDCKYTRSKANLNINEKRKACTYLKKLNKPSAIRSYGKKVNSFLIITHSPRKRQFKNFTDYVKKETEWDGTIILLHPLVLYHLYKFCKEHSELIKDNYNDFKKILVKLFCKPDKEEIYRDLNLDHVKKNLSSYTDNKHLKVKLSEFFNNSALN